MSNWFEFRSQQVSQDGGSVEISVTNLGPDWSANDPALECNVFADPKDAASASGWSRDWFKTTPDKLKLRKGESATVRITLAPAAPRGKPLEARLRVEQAGVADVFGVSDPFSLSLAPGLSPWLWVALAGVGLAVVGVVVYLLIPPTTPECSDAKPCAIGYACADGKCQCGALTACSQGDICLNGACAPAECITGAVGQCDRGQSCMQGHCWCAAAKAACKSTEYCTTTGCVKAECLANKDCERGHTCEKGQCFCGNKAPCPPPQECGVEGCFVPECHRREDCPGGHECREGHCRCGNGPRCDGTAACIDNVCKECLQDADCSGGHRCVGFRCRCGAQSRCPVGKICATGNVCKPRECAQDQQCGTLGTCQSGECRCGTGDACEATQACTTLAGGAGGTRLGCVPKCEQQGQCPGKDQICASKLCATLQWSENGPIAGRDCVQWLETSDRHGCSSGRCAWQKNNLCSNIPVDLTWHSAGPKAGAHCIKIIEPSDSEKTWDDNYLCGELTRELQWSNAGALQNKQCLPITAAFEPAASTWTDNYLCWNSPPKRTFAEHLDLVKKIERVGAPPVKP